MNIWLLTYKIKLQSKRFGGWELWNIIFMQVFISITDQYFSEDGFIFIAKSCVFMKSIFFKITNGSDNLYLFLNTTS